jgi:hypothetical protein
MKSHELAHKLLSMPDMEILIPIPGEYNLIQSLTATSIGISGTKGDSQNPYKESVILQGEKNEKTAVTTAK